MERHRTPQPTFVGRATIRTGNIDPRMHPATLAVKTVRLAPNWEQLSGMQQIHHS
jgi:hypothetical protein